MSSAASMGPSSTVSALKSLKLVGASAQSPLDLARTVIASQNSVPRCREVIRDWMLDLWANPNQSDSPHPAINEGYYSLLNDISPTPLPALSPNVMRNVFDNANEVLPEVIVQTLSQGSYLDMPMEWIEALVAAVLWVAKVGGTGNAEPLLDVVLGRVADLCLDYTMAKRIHSRLAETAAYWSSPCQSGRLGDRLTSILFPGILLHKPLDLAAPSTSALGSMAVKYIAAMHRHRHSLFVQHAANTTDRISFERDSLSFALYKPTCDVLDKLESDTEAHVRVWQALCDHLRSPSGIWGSLMNSQIEDCVRLVEQDPHEEAPWRLIYVLSSVTEDELPFPCHSLVSACVTGITSAQRYLGLLLRRSTSLKSLVGEIVKAVAACGSSNQSARLETLKRIASAIDSDTSGATLNVVLHLIETWDEQDAATVDIAGHLVSMRPHLGNLPVSKFDQIKRGVDNAIPALAPVLALYTRIGIPLGSEVDAVLFKALTAGHSSALQISRYLLCCSEVNVYSAILHSPLPIAGTTDGVMCNLDVLLPWERASHEEQLQLCGAIIRSGIDVNTVYGAAFWDLSISDVYIECAVECQNLTAVSRVVTHARARQTEQLGTILLDAALSDPSQWMGTIKYITKFATPFSRIIKVTIESANPELLDFVQRTMSNEAGACLDTLLGIDIGDLDSDSQLLTFARILHFLHRVTSAETRDKRFAKLQRRLQKRLSKTPATAETIQALSILHSTVSPDDVALIDKLTDHAWRQTTEVLLADSKAIDQNAAMCIVELLSQVNIDSRTLAVTLRLLQTAPNGAEILGLLDDDLYAAVWRVALGRDMDDILVGLCASTRNGSGKVVTRHMAQTIEASRSWSVIRALVEHRFMLLDACAFAALCTRAATDMWQYQEEAAVGVLHEMCARRPDLVAENGSFVVGAMVSAVRLVQQEPVQSSIVSRLFSQICSPSKKRSLGKQSSGAMLNHAPAVLLAYVRAVCDSVRPLTPMARSMMERGIHDVCDMVSVGQDRDRQGEGLGAAWGVGDGQTGEAEREVWAQLWVGYRRKRYAGQG